MNARKPGSLVVAPSSKPGNGTLWRDIHSVDGAYCPAYVGEAIESDAVLFVAAPDMLAALKSALNATSAALCQLDSAHAAFGPIKQAHASARAAIAKAEGRT